MTEQSPLSYISPAMLEDPSLDPHMPVLLAARSPDGPSIRTNLGAMIVLFRLGLVEPTPDGNGLRISDKGIAYARKYRDGRFT